MMLIAPASSAAVACIQHILRAKGVTACLQESLQESRSLHLCQYGHDNPIINLQVASPAATES